MYLGKINFDKFSSDFIKIINLNGKKYLMYKFSNLILWLINFLFIIIFFY